MDSNIIALGDIVSLKSHPYLPGITDILVSGEPLQVSPLMIVVEISESLKGEEGNASDEYTCLWYSSKSNKFERSKIKGRFVKVIFKAEGTSPQLKPGDLVSLRTLDFELAKKKSTLHFEDTSISQGNAHTTITAHLSFLPPILHCIDVKNRQEINQTTAKKTPNAKTIRSQTVAKCLWFNHILERFSEETLPIEALKIIPSIRQELILEIRKCIEFNKTVKFLKRGEITYLFKPRSIVSRSGFYFMRGYDYVLNRISEIGLHETDTLRILETPFINKSPKFNITKEPMATSVDYINRELISAIQEAKMVQAYIRIKYKNRNDQLTIRTLKDYEIFEVPDDDNRESYLVGFCILRQSTRTFRISRIQNFQQLDISFD